MKLQSHISYENSIDLPSVSDAEFREKSRNNRKFRELKLEKWMFIPCDSDGNVLEYPNQNNHKNGLDYKSLYQQAKENVIFDGSELLYQDVDDICFQNQKREAFIFSRKNNLCESDEGDEYKTIEDLVKYNLTLTENAIKK